MKKTLFCPLNTAVLSRQNATEFFCVDQPSLRQKMVLFSNGWLAAVCACKAPKWCVRTACTFTRQLVEIKSIIYWMESVVKSPTFPKKKKQKSNNKEQTRKQILFPFFFMFCLQCTTVKLTHRLLWEHPSCDSRGTVGDASCGLDFHTCSHDVNQIWFHQPMISGDRTRMWKRARKMLGQAFASQLI